MSPMGEHLAISSLEQLAIYQTSQMYLRYDNWLVVSNIFLCSSLFGEMIQFDEHIFQMGGSTTN